MKSLDAVVAAQKRGEARGIASICSAHPVALDAAMRHAAGLASPLLVEATCNQVNQFGGYTGMQPADFVRYVHGIAAKAGLPVEDLLLGGDHLGPLVWANEPAQAAMEKAKALVRAYAAAGFGKIHLDCSMPCADDAELPVEVIARRAAELAQAAEEVAGSRAPRYVIGSEVPPAGGARSGDSGLSVTRPEAAAETIEITRQAFVRLRLEAAWERVVALVVQPGVEFGDEDVHEYDRSQATGLARLIETLPGMVYEAHSTDYQTRERLHALVEDHFAILKVGPALTFAFREAAFALAQIEEAWIEGEPSRIREVLEQEMLANPAHWQRHYAGTPRRQKLSRSFSLSDRIRYYWSEPRVSEAFNRLLHNLADRPLPLALVSQFLPLQYKKIRDGQLANRPYDLLIGQVTDVLDDYRYACGS